MDDRVYIKAACLLILVFLLGSLPTFNKNVVLVFGETPYAIIAWVVYMLFILLVGVLLVMPKVEEN